MSFDSPDLNLGKLLDDVHEGKVQLPDFQREWKWDDDRIRSLLTSISLGHPVGVVMMLEVGGDDVRFAPKLISGVPGDPRAADRLLLDGQQRLTSLYQSLYSHDAVNTTDAKGKRLKRWYYVDIRESLKDDADLEEAILSVPEDRTIRSDFGRVVERDFSTLDKECEAEVFPLSRAFDQSAIFEWQNRFVSIDPSRTMERSQRWNDFFMRVLNNLISYTVPVIVLGKETPKEAVCTVFEKVNTGGVALNVFELLTATFASDDFQLKTDWDERRIRLAVHPALASVESTDFLQAVTLLATNARKKVAESAGDGNPPGISCKRRDVLRLKLDEYKEWAEPVTQALIWTSSFLAQEKIFRAADVPYRSQLVPLAAIRVMLGADADIYAGAKKLQQWYWCGVLGELYGGTTETRFARDFEQVPSWVQGTRTEVPVTVAEATFRAGRLLTLRTRLSAAYKGVYALLMRDGCMDWIKRQPLDMAAFFDYQVDIHHVFPKAWCAKNGIDKYRRESIVNKTALSFDTNRSIGGRSPSDYVPTVEKKAGIGAGELDAIIQTHLIDPTFLREANFDSFFVARTEGLLQLIEGAMGKPAVRDDLLDSDAASYEDEPEETTDEVQLAEEPVVA